MKLLKENFVCVALDARKERGEYKDADGDFVRATSCVTVTASGSICVVTAGAKALGPYGSPGTGMEKWLHEKLKAYAALPESERRPAAVDQPAFVDPKRAALTLPPDALIVRVFNRHLGWNADKSVRYAAADDYLPGASKAEVERYTMAQNDFMWIPKNEWQALIPHSPKAGATHDVPPSFAMRLFRFHLDPARGFTEGLNFAASRSNAGELTLTVESVDEGTVVMRLEGWARLKQSGRDVPGVYSPAILGYLNGDRKTGRLTRLDLVALGAASGLPCDANGKVAFRKGEYPVGIAFELVTNPTAAEKLHPRGARDNPGAYLEPKERR